MNSKKILIHSGIFTLSLTILLFFLSRHFFLTFLQIETAQLNKWDICQYLLGYLPASDSAFSYIDKENFNQLFIPFMIQAIGIIYAVFFIRIPVSFQVFVKSRIRIKEEFYWFFLKNSLIKTAIYVITLFSSIIVTIYLSDYLSATSTFHYQQGNWFLSIMLFHVTLFLMILAIVIFVFLGYVHGKSIQYIVTGLTTSLIIHIVDRFSPFVNLVLFDNQHYYIDSIIFWLAILCMELLMLKFTRIFQEEFND